MLYFLCYSMKEEDSEDPEFEDDNPWAISTLKDFLYFCCPECDDKKQSEVSFVIHALQKHKRSSKYLKQYVDESGLSDFLLSTNVKQETSEVTGDQMLDNDTHFHDEKVSIKSKVVLKEDGEVYVEYAEDLTENVSKSDNINCDVSGMDFSNAGVLRRHNEDFEESYEYEENGTEELFEFENNENGIDLEAPTKVEGLDLAEVEHENNLKSEPESYENDNSYEDDNENEIDPDWNHQDKKTKKNKTKDEEAKFTKVNKDEFKCDMCDKIYRSSSSVKRHIMKTHVKKGIKCRVCNELFKSMVELNNHKNTLHSKTTRPACNHCEKTFKMPSDLLYHKIQLHSEKGHTCEECKKAFTTDIKLQIHFSKRHKGTINVLRQKCELCGKRIIDMKKHQSYRNKCDICGVFICGSESNLINHVNLIHKKIKDHQCEACGKSFGTKQYLTFHIKSVHKKLEYIHKCEICEKRFMNKGLLLSHIKIVHDKIREFSCDMCAQLFNRKSHLTSHIRSIHEKVKAAKCEICGKPYANQRGLRTHMNSVHFNVREYQCHVCTKAFSRCHHLQNHLDKIHQIQITFQELKLSRSAQRNSNNLI